MERFVRYTLIAIFFLFLLIVGFIETKKSNIEHILSQNMWYISSALKKDGTSIEPSNDIPYVVFDFNKDNSYTVYQSLFPRYEFAALYYYGNESFKVKGDSLLMDDYIGFKLVKVTRDSIVLEYQKTYVAHHFAASEYYYNVNSDLLVYTLKPIFINPVPDSIYGRKDRSFSKPSIVD